MRLWEQGLVEQSRDIGAHDGAVWSAVFSPDGSQVVSAGADKMVRVWDVAGGQAGARAGGPHRPGDGRRLQPRRPTTSSRAAATRCSSCGTPRPAHEMRTFTGHTRAVTAAAFSPDGKRIVSGGADWLIKIWDTDKGKELKSIAGHQAVVGSVAWSPDGKHIASGSGDHTIKLWNADTYAEERTLAGHSAAVSCVAFSNDGKKLASCGGDQRVLVWNLAGRDERVVRRPHQRRQLGGVQPGRQVPGLRRRRPGGQAVGRADAAGSAQFPRPQELGQLGGVQQRRPLHRLGQRGQDGQGVGGRRRRGHGRATAMRAS